MVAAFANELRLLLRDRGAAVWLLLGPVLVMSLITAARYQSGQGPRFLLPVVDEDQGPVARTFIKLLGRRVDLLELTRAEAESLVRDQGRAAAAVVFPPGLSKRYLQGRPGEIVLLTDPAEPVGIGRLKVALLLMSRDAAELADPVGPPRLEVVEHNLTGDQLSRKSHEQNVPGFAIMFTLLSLVYGTAQSLHLEARAGTIARLLVAPVGFGRILLAKAALRVVAGAVQLLALLGWGWLVFGVSLGSSATALLAIATATAFASAALGTLLAGIGRSAEQLLPLSLALVLPLCAVSGLWWPLHAAPAWMKALSSAVFPTWAMRGLTDLVLRDRGLAAVVPELTMLLVQGALLLVVGIWLFRRQLASR
ncbi:MAG: ABC transporter permease [Thermodesulfobacteriota bacterium]